MPTPQSTRAQLRTDVINWMDAAASGGASHWDITAGTGEVDRRLGMVHMQEWRRVLNAMPWYQVTQYTPVTDANGNVPFTALSSGTGDNQQNMYRILSVGSGLAGANGLFYTEIKTQEVAQFLQIATTGVQYNAWFPNGRQITVPGNLSTQLTVWVNWTPTRFDQLASDSSLVSLPDDYEDIFALEGAARLLMKGGAETPASIDLKNQAEEQRRDRLQDLSRVGIQPWGVSADDNRWDWGSQ